MKKNVDEENQRMNQELTNLKQTHQEQVAEIKIGQRNEINEMVDSHKKTLDQAKQKFAKERAKVNA
jgi:molecular chaperone DnaK (HSP70)